MTRCDDVRGLWWTRVFACVLLGISAVSAWDQDQLEVFDVVEEVNQNFYELMNISQNAEHSQVKQAFRNLSLVLHPDKNPSPDADVQFRNLVSVYNILRDANKRKYYDEVLVNGLPNWRSAVYYYRHYRKMGLTEMICILFVLITTGQYLIGWAAYLEKKYTHEQVYQAKIEKKKKKLTKKGQLVEDISEKFDLPRPSFSNTLPIQIPRFLWWLIFSFPSLVRFIKNLFEESERQRKEKEEQERLQKELELVLEQKRIRDKAIRKRKQQAFKLEERDDIEMPIVNEPQENVPEIQAKKPVSGGLWTDDDLAELVQLVKKFPGGTTDRWEKIADQMNRTVGEVTYMAAKLKENCYRIPGQSAEQETSEDTPARKQKTKGGKVADNPERTGVEDWTQTQQKALEAALAKYPKGPTDRWDKIANCVPNKTKEECMLRFKYLAELVRKKKGSNEQDAE